MNITDSSMKRIEAIMKARMEGMTRMEKLEYLHDAGMIDNKWYEELKEEFAKEDAAEGQSL